MITVSISGGLGNQMFQYAAAYALARRHETGVIMEISEYLRHPQRQYKLDIFQIPQVFDNPRPRWQSKLRLSIKKRSRVFGLNLDRGLYREPHFHFDPDFFKLPGSIRVHGKFISPVYFADIADEIRSLFTLTQALSDDAMTTMQRINRCAVPVSVHVRRGDYASDPKAARTHGTLTLAYYKRALRVLGALLASPIEVFVFSDDPAWVNDAFDFVPDCHVVRGDPASPQNDLLLMCHCKHHVVANSTFSWWGAWLNPSVDAIVIAPRQWFGVELARRNNTVDLLPPEWITV